MALVSNLTLTNLVYIIVTWLIGIVNSLIYGAGRPSPGNMAALPGRSAAGPPGQTSRSSESGEPLVTSQPPLCP